MMPTSTASDHIERKSTSTEAVNPLTGKSVSLDRFVKFWPTPEIQASGTPKMWPTPAAQQAGTGELLNTLETKDGQPPEPGQRAYNPKTGKHVQITLNRAVKMWPTPKASQGGGERSGNRAGTGDLNYMVRQEARMLPTPTASMHKGSSPATLTRKNGRDRSNDRLDHAMQAEQGSGQLNPQWVEWLMGYPQGWTDLKD
jgi:hypothetical protein